MNRHTRRGWLALVAGIGALSGCSALSLTSPSTPEHALPGGGRPLFGGPKRDKVPPANAAAPSRDLDLADPTGGRLTLVEMHRRAIEKIQDLESAQRAKDQQLAELQMASAELRSRLDALTESSEKNRSAREQLEKENLELKARVLDLAVKLAETEKEMLQLKIDALKDRAGRAPAKRPAEAPKESKENKENKEKEEDHR